MGRGPQAIAVEGGGVHGTGYDVTAIDTDSDFLAVDSERDREPSNIPVLLRRAAQAPGVSRLPEVITGGGYQRQCARRDDVGARLHLARHPTVEERGVHIGAAHAIIVEEVRPVIDVRGHPDVKVTSLFSAEDS
jgi:hypothetical protein